MSTIAVRAAAAYRTTHVRSRSPVELVVILYDGLVSCLTEARDAWLAGPSHQAYGALARARHRRRAAPWARSGKRGSGRRATGSAVHLHFGPPPGSQREGPGRRARGSAAARETATRGLVSDRGRRAGCEGVCVTIEELAAALPRLHRGNRSRAVPSQAAATARADTTGCVPGPKPRRSQPRRRRTRADRGGVGLSRARAEANPAGHHRPEGRSRAVGRLRRHRRVPSHRRRPRVGYSAGRPNTLAELKSAEIARRTSAQTVETGEATLAAYRRVLTPALGSSGLINRHG